MDGTRTSPGLRPPATSHDMLRPDPLGRASPLEAQQSFAGILGRASLAQLSPGEKARAAAQQYVAQTLVLPILKQMRESDRTPPPFAPSQGEKQFRALMDAELAQKIVQARSFPLVDRVAHDLLKRGGHAADPPSSTPP